MSRSVRNSRMYWNASVTNRLDMALVMAYSGYGTCCRHRRCCWWRVRACACWRGRSNSEYFHWELAFPWNVDGWMWIKWEKLPAALNERASVERGQRRRWRCAQHTITHVLLSSGMSSGRWSENCFGGGNTTSRARHQRQRRLLRSYDVWNERARGRISASQDMRKYNIRTSYVVQRMYGYRCKFDGPRTLMAWRRTRCKSECVLT